MTTCNCETKTNNFLGINNDLDYYPSVPEGKLYCVGGADINKKKMLALKMREFSMDGCPYVIIDSTNSRIFISHCTGYDSVSAIQNNERIAEVAEMLIKQGINVIVLTTRAELVYVLLRNKLENIKIIDVTCLDVESINNIEQLKEHWNTAYND